jgi:hypothetical protein
VKTSIKSTLKRHAIVTLFTTASVAILASLSSPANAEHESGHGDSQATVSTTVSTGTTGATQVLQPDPSQTRPANEPVISAASQPVQEDQSVPASNDADPALIALTIGLGVVALGLFGAGFIAFMRQARRRDLPPPPTTRR